jgi:hypothetical protein
VIYAADFSRGNKEHPTTRHERGKMNTEKNPFDEPEYVPVDEEGKPVTTHEGGSTELVVRPSTFEGMTFASPDELPDLDAAEEGINIAPQYYEFLKAGDTVRAIFNGMTSITSTKNVKPGEPARVIPTAVFQNKGGVYINSGANLVNQIRNLRPGTPVQIEYQGEEKTSSGNKIKKFEVHILKIAK